jgi:acyl-coenzyme A thioesterase PaaI-like protein
MKIATHQGIDASLCGTAVELEPGRSRVRLLALDSMTADDSGLVHGGFVFGLADYAAMLAVNEPTVVLGAAECRFLKPVRAGQELEAVAVLAPVQDRKHFVDVEVLLEGEAVFTGRFTCFVPKRHVLAPAQ